MEKINVNREPSDNFKKATEDNFDELKITTILFALEIVLYLVMALLILVLATAITTLIYQFYPLDIQQGVSVFSTTVILSAILTKFRLKRR